MSVYVPNHRRAGEYLYEISDNNGVRDVGIIPDAMLKSRSFQGRTSRDWSGSAGPDLPGFTERGREDRNLANRNLKVIVYRIPRTVTDPIITKSIWAELQKSHKIENVTVMPLPPLDKP